MESICLNMIVKNEAHVIKETLENILNYIPLSYYVISDTGSTDNTIEVIKTFFNSKNIKGEIYSDEWKDFGYNRSLALQHAYKKTKYLLIFDADDKIFGKFPLLKDLNLDSYHFKFGLGVTYKRLLLVNNYLKWEFIGVLHEYISCIDKKNFSSGIIDGDYYVESGKTGSRSKDPEKYSKDAIILENAFYESEKNNSHLKIRYAFYCAQSYRDSNNKENAIKWYKKRAELKDWEQEVYFSYFMIGNLYNDLKETEKAFYYWNLAIEIDKERYESIYQIISHLRQNNFHSLAYNYYLMIQNKNIDLNNKLFVFYPIYEYQLDYEMIFIFFYQKKYKEGIENTIKLLKIFNSLPLDIKFNIIQTTLFFLDFLEFDLSFNELYLNFVRDLFIFCKKNNIRFMPIYNEKIKITVDKLTSLYKNFNNDKVLKIVNKKNKSDKKIKVFLSITSCKRYDLFEKTIDSILICFKDIELIDYFFCVDDNSSKEDRKKMLTKYPFFKYYFKKEEEKGHLSSMNIIFNKMKELKPKYWIHLEDDWLFVKPYNYVKKSIDFLEKYREQNERKYLNRKARKEAAAAQQTV